MKSYIIFLLVGFFILTSQPSVWATNDEIQFPFQEEQERFEQKWKGDKNLFYYYETEFGYLPKKESDLILTVEITSIEKCCNILSHINFCFGCKILKSIKGDYDRPAIGFEIDRVIPMAPYDPRIYKFEIGDVIDIRAKIEDDSYTFVDLRFPSWEGWEEIFSMPKEFLMVSGLSLIPAIPIVVLIAFLAFAKTKRRRLNIVVSLVPLFIIALSGTMFPWWYLGVDSSKSSDFYVFESIYLLLKFAWRSMVVLFVIAIIAVIVDHRTRKRIAEQTGGVGPLTAASHP